MSPARTGSPPSGRPSRRRTATRSGALAREVYLQLKQAILDCSIPPGRTFYSAELAERFGVSKTPVRDALRQLSQEGFVEVYPRSGYQVRPVKFQDVHELFDLRGLLGPHAARAAARNITEAQLAELEAIVEAAYDRGAGHEALIEANHRFHLLIARAAGNARLLRIMESVFDEMERLFRLRIDLTRPSQEMGASLHALVDALRRRDGDAAAAIEAEHAAASAQFVMRSLFEAARHADLAIPAMTQNPTLPTQPREETP